MNLHIPIPCSTHRPALWPLAVIALFCLSVLLAGMPFRTAVTSAYPPAVNDRAVLSSQSVNQPQIAPVPNPRLPMKTPDLSATPVPAEARPVPIPRPVATPPVRK